MLMEGIKILSQETINVQFEFAGIAISGILLILIGIGIAVDGIKNDSFLTLTMSIVLSVSGLGLVMTGLDSPKPFTKYKVIINDNVKMIEFNKKYEIIKQEGEIYTIKKK